MRKAILRAAILAGLLGLGACAGQSASTVLANTATAACAAQAEANALGALATSLGNTKAAQSASVASVATGTLCTWPTPVPAK